MPRLRHFYGLNHLRYVTTSIPKGGIAPASSTRSGLSGFSFKFVTTLADLRGELGFRIVGYVLIPPGGTVTYCSGPRTAPTPPTAPACSAGPAVRPCGSSSDVGSCRVANKGIRIIMGHAVNIAARWKSRKPACSAGPAVRPLRCAQGRLCGSSSDAGSCRVANRTIRFRLGLTPNTVSENIQAAPSKPRRSGKAHL